MPTPWPNPWPSNAISAVSKPFGNLLGTHQCQPSSVDLEGLPEEIADDR